ncbi:AAA-ATPase At2g46620-like [Phalaenopsis equestris]|uniref:AAA-ATPase At2g46620-like n=1 Tax=Phalaenopsis equestris TaxID=78828 RepID=UPI0009E57DDE|nr:AAA-ATPase At2g46620-like [Phalaenopsis equestris]
MITPAAGKLLSTAIAAAACFFLLLRIIISLKSLIFLIARLYRWTEDHTQAHQTFTIPRQADDDLPENPLYRKAAAYVAALPAAEDSDHTSLLSSFSRPNDISVHLIPGQIVLDSFFGARLSWTFVSPAGSGDALVLRLRRQDRHRVLRPYLRHVESVAEEIEIRRKEIKLYTNAAGSVGRRWRSVTMSHPATFDTLVMDPEFKARVRADLELFLKGRAYYARMGRVWKRSYFLYGSPGTGKSSFVVAMARFLGYNVYDLDLPLVSGAGDLRSLLLDTWPRSVILVEDLDRYLAAATGEARISGLLCFMDGVFSCCGEERIMVFTASGEKEVAGLEQEVVRSGRVDFPIHFPRCDFTAFKTMAGSYLGVTDHKLYAQVEEGFQNGGQLSHAELGEIMLANRCSPSRAIKNVISALQRSSSSTPAAAVEKKNCGGKVEEGIKEGGKEIRRLYGLIRMRSWSKKERRMPVEINGVVAGE